MKNSILVSVLFATTLFLAACSGFNGDSNGGNGAAGEKGWVTITGPAANIPTQNGVTLTGTCDSALVVEFAGDLASPDTATCTNKTFSAVVIYSNGDGPKVITVSQKNSAGVEASASRTFVKDTTPPAVHITAPGAGTNIALTFTLAGMCENGLPVLLSGTGLVSPASATCANGAFSVVVTVTTGDGDKTIGVTQTDAAGNIGIDSRSLTLDSSAPLVTITSPAPDTATATGLTLTGTCETAYAVNVTGDITAPITATCTAGKFSVPITLTAGTIGIRHVVVSQTNISGVTGTTSRDFAWNDTSLPTKCGATAILTWTKPTTNTDGTALTDLAGFNIYYGTTSKQYGKSVNVPSPTLLTSTIAALPEGSYYFTMTAYNSAKTESAYANEVGIVLLDCMTAVYDMSTHVLKYIPYANSSAR